MNPAPASASHRRGGARGRGITLPETVISLHTLSDEVQLPRRTQEGPLDCITHRS